MSKHTAGPWRVARASLYAGNDLNVDSYEHGYVALCGKRGDEVAEANANLIAAAPEMLDALRRAVLALAFAAETSPAMHDDYEAVSAAIKKATGAQP